MKGVASRFSSLGVTDLLFAQLYPLVSSVLITFVTARVLGPEGRGALAFVTATCTLAGAVMFMSLHVGAAELQSKERPGLLTALRIAAALDALVVGSVFALHLAGLVDVKGVWLAVGSALVALNLVVLRCVQAIGGNLDFRRSWAIQSLGYAAVGIPVVMWTKSWQCVLACWVAALILSTLYSARAFRRNALSLTPSSEDYRRTLAASTMAHMGSIGMQVLYRADLVVLGIVSTATQTGYYSIAVTATGFVWNIAEAFSLRAFQRGGATENAPDGGRLLRVNAAVSTIVGAGICLAAIVLIPLVLPGYRASIPLVLILMIGVVAQGPARVAMASLQRLERYGSVMAVGAVAVLFSFTYLPVAALWGAAGLAWASTLAYCVLAALVLLVWRHSAATTQPRRVEARP